MRVLKPVKVLQIGMTCNWGGTETYLMQQFDNIDCSKVQYDFVNITSEKDIVFKDAILSSGSMIYGICSRHKNPIKHYYQWILLLCKVAKDYKAIVLNANSLEYVFPLFAGKLFSIPVRVIHSHNAGYGHEIGLLRKLLISFNRFLMRWSATNYFACSIKAGKWMFGSSVDFKVIHNAIDISNYSFKPNIRERKRKELGVEDVFVVGHVGSYNFQKNHEFMLDVFNEICKLQPKSVLLLVGYFVDDDSYWIKAHEKAKAYGIEDRVRFLGIRKDVPELMQAMDCFVLPSRFEGLCLVGIEAQASGLPCFFSDTITRELEITDLCHFIGLNKAPEEWADIILKNSTIERRDMSQEISDAGYDIKTEVKKIERIYLEG